MLGSERESPQEKVWILGSDRCGGRFYVPASLDHKSPKDPDQCIISGEGVSGV